MGPSSRRHFLARLTQLTAAIVALPTFLRCNPSGPPPPTLAEQSQAYRNSLACTATTGLWEAEIKTRADNEYIDRSVRTDQFCFACKNFEPAVDRQTCATCRTVKGPIHPLGWCKSWTEKP